MELQITNDAIKYFKVIFTNCYKIVFLANNYMSWHLILSHDLSKNLQDFTVDQKFITNDFCIIKTLYREMRLVGKVK